MLSGRNFSVGEKIDVNNKRSFYLVLNPRDSSLTKVIRFFSTDWIHFLARESESVLGSSFKVKWELKEVIICRGIYF